MSNALANITDSSMELRFNPSQLEILKNSVFPGFTDDDLKYAIEFAQSVKLNPIRGELHMLKQNYKDKSTGQWLYKLTPYIPVQGYRVIAHRSGMLEQIIGPFWVDEQNVEHKILPPGSKLHAATAAIKRKDYPQPFWAVVYWIETGGSEPTGNWAKMPRHMLGKTALARALREAFPTEIGGTYSEEEVELFGDPEEMRVEVSQGHTRPDVKKTAPPLPAPSEPVQVAEEPEAPAKSPEDAQREVLYSVIKDGMRKHTAFSTGKIIWKDVRAVVAMMSEPGPLSDGKPDMQRWSLEQVEELADLYEGFDSEPYKRPEGWEESTPDEASGDFNSQENLNSSESITDVQTEVENPL